MGKMKQEFSIYPVQKVYKLKKKDGSTVEKKSKRVFHVAYYDIEGHRKTKSTGQTSKGAATNIVQKWISEGLFEVTDNKLTFENYAKDWWIWDKCNYVAKKKAKGMQIGESYVEANRGNLKNHILPYFKDMKLIDIKKKTIESWLLHLHNSTNLSPTTINHNLAILKTMLKEAKFNDYIAKNPAEGIKTFKESPKEKDIISVEQYQKLFSPTGLENYWENNLFYFVLNAVATDTGMRMGEIQVLQVQDVKKVDGDYLLYVIKGWTRKYGLKNQTKRRESDRRVKISSDTYNDLQNLIKLQDLKEPTDFIFPSPIDKNKPIGNNAITNSLNKALKAVGISEKERKERNITFHSWRHFRITFGKGITEEEKLLAQVGHTNARTNDGYFKISDEK